MKQVYTLLFALLLFTGTALAQKKTAVAPNPYSRIDRWVDQEGGVIGSLDSVALFINTAFTTEEDRARAIFCWVTKNIAYSTDLMFTYTNDNSRTKLVKDAFENKLAVCIGYATLFDTLCKLSHIESYIVQGSTRQSFLPVIIGHAWNAIKINGNWRLADPTWGSGYLQGKNFVAKRNDLYFLTPPEKLIATHMPLDPIWQLMSRPVNLYQFHAQIKSTAKTDWNYNDSIQVYLSSTEIQHIKSAARRLKESGTDSEITHNYFNYLHSKELNYYAQQCNTALRYNNDAVSQYNDYINFKNKQFTPAKTDAQLAAIMPAISANLKQAEDIYAGLENQTDDANINSVIRDNYKQLTDMKEHVKSETEFVNKYLATKKNKRRDLFYTKTYTLWGVPIK